MEEQFKELIKEYTFENSCDFLKIISYKGMLYQHLCHNSFAYRGVSSDNFRLIPSVLRKTSKHALHSHFRDFTQNKTLREQVAYEFDILREFYYKCDEQGLYIPENKRFRGGIFSFDDCDTITKDGLWLPEDLYDITALAQHYGIPTRLLDWTYDINIAIYFAIMGLYEENITINEDDFINIWAININHQTWLTISLIYSDFPLKIIRPIYKYNPNLQAQKGLFTLWEIYYKANGSQEINSDTLDDSIRSYFNRKEKKIENCILIPPFMFCFKIRQTRKNILELYQYIKGNNIDSSILFPGYNGVAKYILSDRIHIPKIRN